MVGFGSVGELYVEIGADISKLNAGIAAASAKIMGFERKFANVGSKIGGGLSNSFSKIGSGLAAVGTAAAVTGGILGVGLAAGAVKSAGAFKDFESAVANAASVTGKVGAEFDAAKASISAVAMELGQKTAFSSAEAANAMYDLASAGYDVSSMVASDLQPMLDLAAGTQYDLSQTTATMASTLSQFGLGFESAGRLADTFAAAAGKTQASMEKLSYSMKYVGTISHSANMGLEETTAALGLLYNAGLNGESAGTGLRGVLASLISPTTKAAGVLKSMGLTIDDVNPTTKGFTNVIAALAAAGLDTNEAFDIFGREAAPAILALTSQSGELANLTTELQNAGGAAQTMADQQLDTLKGSLEALSGSIENVFISVGAALSPAIRGIADAINTFMPGIQEWAVKISTSFSDFIGGLVASQYSVQAIVSTIATAIGNIFSAITGGISGADAGNAVSHFIGDLSSKVAVIVPKIESVVIKIINFFKSLVSGLAPTFDSIKFIISDIVKVFQAFFSGLDGSGSASIITGVINGIATALSYLSGVVGWALSSIAPTIKNIFTSIADTLNSIDFSGAWEKISIAFEQLPFFIEDAVSGLNFGAIWDSLKSAFENIKNVLSDIDFNGIWDSLVSSFNTAKTVITDFISALAPSWDNLKSSFESIKTIIGMFTPVFSAFLEVFAGADAQDASRAAEVLAGAINLITGAIASILKFVAQHPTLTKFTVAVAALAAGLAGLGVAAGIISGIMVAFEVAVIGSIVSVIGSIVSFGSAISAGIGVITGALAMLTNPVTVAIGLIALIYVAWARDWGGIKTIVLSAVTDIQASFNRLVAYIPTAVSQINSSLSTLVSQINSSLSTLVSQINSSLSTLYSSTQNYWTQIKTAFSTAAASIISTLQSLYAQTQAKFNQIVAAIANLVSRVIAGFQQMVSAIRTKATEIVNAIGEIPGKILSKAAAFYNAGVQIIQKLIDGLKSKLQTVKDTVNKIKDAASLDGISSVASKGAKNIGEGVSKAIKSTGAKAKVSLSQAASGLRRLLPSSPAKEGPFKKLPNWDVVFRDPLKESIFGAKKLVTPLSNMLSGIKNPIESASVSVMRGSSVGYSRNESFKSMKSQTITKRTNVKIGTVNNNGDSVTTARMKRALGV